MRPPEKLEIIGKLWKTPRGIPPPRNDSNRLLIIDCWLSAADFQLLIIDC